MQAVVWEHVAPLIRSCADGFNACIFAYGQTGSGKAPIVLTQAVQIPIDNCISWKIFTSDDGDELQPAMNKSEDSGSKDFQQRVQVRHTPCKGQLQILG